jgi:transposase
MEVVYPCCCGLDVHKKSITACVLWAEAKGKSRQEKKRFGTFTHDLLQLADWLQECGVTHVAMESTGVYWKPVWNILAEQFEALLVNAQHIKAVPGRKTDQKDSEWIADLLQHGLLRGSFVPPRPTRELRDLTRYRVSLAQKTFARIVAPGVTPGTSQKVGRI